MINLKNIKIPKNNLNNMISPEKYMSLNREDMLKYKFVPPVIGSAGYGYYKLKKTLNYNKDILIKKDNI